MRNSSFRLVTAMEKKKQINNLKRETTQMLSILCSTIYSYTLLESTISELFIENNFLASFNPLRARSLPPRSKTWNSHSVSTLTTY